MTLYDKVKEQATAKGKSIAAVEREAGIANGTIAGWKDGKPLVNTLKKVADYFGVSIEYFLEG